MIEDGGTVPTVTENPSQGGLHEKASHRCGFDRIRGFSIGARCHHEGDPGQADALTWKDNPAFPKGVQARHPGGRPDESWRDGGPPHQVPAQLHIRRTLIPMAEVVTVLSGSVGTRMGEKLEKEGDMSRRAHCGCNRQSTRIMLGPERRRRSFKFSSSAREASTTSTRLTIRARNRERRWRGLRPVPGSNILAASGALRAAVKHA